MGFENYWGISRNSQNDLEYTVNISDDIVDVKDLVNKTRKKYPLDSLIKKLIKLVKEGQ